MKDFEQVQREHEERMARMQRSERRLTIVKDGLILLIIGILLGSVLVYIH